VRDDGVTTKSQGLGKAHPPPPPSPFQILTPDQVHSLCKPGLWPDCGVLSGLLNRRKIEYNMGGVLST